MPADRIARQSRLDRNAVSHAAERDIDRLFKPLSVVVRDSVRRHATDRITPLSYALIMRDLDRALEGIRGRYPGDPEAPLYRLVMKRCLQARAVTFRRAVDSVRRTLRREAELLDMIEREA